MEYYLSQVNIINNFEVAHDTNKCIFLQHKYLNHELNLRGGGVPKGYEFQHVDNHSYSTPMPDKVKQTLIKLGFPNAKNHNWDCCKIEVISRNGK